VFQFLKDRHNLSILIARFLLRVLVLVPVVLLLQIVAARAFVNAHLPGIAPFFIDYLIPVLLGLSISSIILTVHVSLFVEITLCWAPCTVLGRDFLSGKYLRVWIQAALFGYLVVVYDPFMPWPFMFFDEVPIVLSFLYSVCYVSTQVAISEAKRFRELREYPLSSLTGLVAGKSEHLLSSILTFGMGIAVLTLLWALLVPSSWSDYGLSLLTTMLVLMTALGSLLAEIPSVVLGLESEKGLVLGSAVFGGPQLLLCLPWIVSILVPQSALFVIFAVSLFSVNLSTRFFVLSISHGLTKRLRTVSISSIVSSALGLAAIFVVDLFLLVGLLASIYFSLWLAAWLGAAGAVEPKPVELAKVVYIIVSLVYGSLFLLTARRLWFKPHMSSETISEELDDHHRLCHIAGQESRRTLDNYRRYGRPRFARSDLTTSKNEIEVGLALALALGLVAAICGFFQMVLPAGEIQLFSQYALETAIALTIMTLYFGVYRKVVLYMKWRSFWIGYWELARDLSGPINRLMDQQQPWTYLDGSTDWGHVNPKKKDAYLRKVRKSARKVCSKRNLQDVPTWADESLTEQLIDEVIWYDEMKSELEEPEALHPDAGPERVFEEIRQDLKSMGALDLPELHEHRYLQYRKLKAEWLYREWPDIISEIINLDNAGPEARFKVFETASDKLRLFADHPLIPLPNSFKWIALYYALVVASSPYVAPFLVRFLGMGVVG